jgi:hypothetical protein
MHGLAVPESRPLPDSRPIPVWTDGREGSADQLKEKERSP